MATRVVVLPIVAHCPLCYTEVGADTRVRPLRDVSQ